MLLTFDCFFYKLKSTNCLIYSAKSLLHFHHSLKSKYRRYEEDVCFLQYILETLSKLPTLKIS